MPVTRPLPRPETLEMIARFIAFPTVSRDSNLPLIEFAADHLRQAGAEISLSFSKDGRKANLLACLGPRDRAGLILSGHTDVVPVDGQGWSHDPFTLTRRGDRVYGRGTSDMKGFLATATALAPRLAERRPDMPIILAMSYDEEVGCLGMPGLIEDLAGFVAPPLGCIVGEPTRMQIVAAQKGKLGCHVTVRGRDAHSALSQLGINAVEAAAEAMHFLIGVKHRLRDEGPRNVLFQPPDYATIEICMASGGTAVNVIPAQASFDFDARVLPGMDPRDIIAELRDHVETHLAPSMRLKDDKAGFTFEEVPGCLAFDQDMNHPFARLVQAVLPPHPVTAVPYGTDAGHFGAAGIPTVICGPGDIAQAHQPDEFIDLDQISLCEAFLERLVRDAP